MNIWEIIDFLNTKSDITDLVWNRIFYWIPADEQTQDFITINIVSWNRPMEVEEKTRLEIRVIAWDTSSLLSELQNITNIVYQNLLTYKYQWIFKLLKVNNVNWFDEKKRKVFIQDLIFYQSL